MKLLLILLSLVTWVSCAPPLAEPNSDGELPALDRADLTDMQARNAMAVPYAPTDSPAADPCLSNPCRNGATCLTRQDTYSCLCAPGWAGTNCNAVLTTPDNRGTQFMLGFLDNGGSQLELFITSASADPASVTITAPGASYTRHLTVTDAAVEVVTLPESLALSGSEKARKGVLVTAEREIIVYGVNKYTRTTDGFLGLPVDVMGTEYIVAAYEQTLPNDPTEFGIFGIEDDTIVNITFSGSARCGGVAYPDEHVASLVLNKFDAVECEGTYASDLTGTRIMSNKPLSLMSGVRCVNIPDGVTYCDHIVEHIPPVNTWGQHFVTVPLALRTAGDIFRIVSASDGTTVNVTGHAPRLLTAGEWWELDVPSHTYQAISASQPVMVLQYSKGTTADGVSSDPFMMYIPPIEQFAADYTFATVDAVGSVYTNYVNIVIKTTETTGLTYDGNRLPSSTTWTVIPGTDLSATQLHITTTGTHKIKHNSAIVTFSIFYYGFSLRDSVGFPGGLRLAKLSGECQMTETVSGDGVDNDCDKLVDEELLNGIDDDGDGLIDEDVAAVAHDLDECELGIAICDDNATCVNTHGSYKCVCDPGFTGDGKVCWARSTCTVFGVTHYNTFDGLAHDFSGQCPTTLSSSCRGGSLPYFHVITNSDPRGDPTTSYVSEVTVEVYNRTIVIQRDKTVYIDQIITTLPAQPFDDLTIKFVGQYVVIETTFGLKVQYDGSHRVEVTVPETYQDALCGLCGNYNGNDTDEFVTPDGSLAADVMQFGNSWLVDGHGEVCVANPPPPNRCDAALQQTVTGLCGMLTDGAHAFAACYSTLNPEGTYQTCVYDMCALNGEETSLCNNLQAYADACAEAGINVGSWRNTSFCPLSCPASSHYDPCSSACPATCTDVSAPLYCNQTCVEGCECDAGYVLSGDQCVLREQCGCTRDGLYYAVGQTWGEGCDRTCECASKNNIQCTGGGCDVNATCAIQNGVQGCYCNPGYWGNGSYCGELCDINPCKNGGTCINDDKGGHICVCASGWSGDECNEDLSPPDPAGPSSTAVPVIIGSYISGMMCDGWTFFLVENDCSSNYYVCSPGHDAPIHFNCPANLVFNKDLGVCDWPDHVPYCSCHGLAGASCQINLDDCSPNPCQNGGLCQDLVGDFVCHCLPSYQGKTCEIFVDPCNSGPCQHGGVCSVSGNKVTCSCQPGWNGNFCEMNIDECSPNPCQNGGVCQDLVADFSCSCPAPYEGKMCEIYVSPCGSGPCQNGGVCSASGATFTCSCQPGWNGATCGMNIDECSPNPCQNGGVCQDLVADFSCSCPAPYEGKMCEIYVDPCGSGPCQNGGVCSASGATFTCSCQPGWNGATCGINIDECNPNPCQNGGVCQDLVADFSCSCPTPYEGKMCETYVSPCSSGPCQNGGVCSATGATFTCSCQPGWNGATCGTNLDECSPNLCQNGGVCQDLVADFSCSCPPLYEGKTCEIYVSTPPPYIPTTAPVITEGAVVPFSPGLTCNGLNFFLLDSDCSNIYYVCSPGHDAPILMYCPATLVFNKDIRVCDNPLAVVYC